MNPAQLLEHFDRISEAPDAVVHLRRFILDLAVRGKLVEQNPNDEPAAELLKRIQAKKDARNIKEKSKPTKSDEKKTKAERELTLPNGWTWVPLADLTAVLNGRAYSKNELLEEGTPVLRVGNLFTSNHWYYSNLMLEDDKYCNHGDLLFAWSASFGPFIWPGPKVIYHYHIWKLSLHSEQDLNKNYLHKFLLHKTQEIKDSGHGVSMIHMTKEKMEKVVVPLPPFAEQHRIVAKVEELMALCDQLEAAKNEREARRDRLVAASLHRIDTAPAAADKAATAAQSATPLRDAARFHLGHLPRLTTRPEHIKQLRQTILNLAVRGRLVPQDPNNDEPAAELLKQISAITGQQAIVGGKVENLFTLPSGWEWSRVGLITTKTGSGSTPRGGKSAYQKAGVPFLRSQNVYNDGLRLNDVAYIDQDTHTRMRGTAIEPGDLLLNITGGSIGRCCLIPYRPIEANISQHVAIIRPAVAGLRDFMHKVVLSPFFQSFVIDEQTGAGRGGLPKNRMDQIPVPIPPLAEQHRIVAKVNELMALCDQLEAQLTAAQTDSRRLLETVLHESLAKVA